MSPNLGIKIGVEGTAQATSALTQMANSVQGLGTTTEKTRQEMEAAKRAFESWNTNNTALPRLNDQIKQVGVSAGQTRMALQQLPLQFQDIVVSLQGGQSPLQVLLQQGSQISGSFGGVGVALRETAKYALGLVNPFTVAAAAAGTLGFAYFQASKEADAFVKTIAMTGNAVGASANQMAGMAANMGSTFGVTVGKAAEAINTLAATGRVGRASLEEFATGAIAAEKALGMSLDTIAKNFADLGKDPVGASARLNETMNYLTASTYLQIKAAQDLGQTTKAAALAQGEYDQALRTASNSVVQNLGYIQRAWGGITGGAKAAWDAMLNVGRPVSISTQMGEVQKNLDAALAKRKTMGDDTAFAPGLDKEIAKLKEQLSVATELENINRRAGDAAVLRNATNKEGIAAIDAIAKANSAAATQQEQSTKALAAYRKEVETLRKIDPNSALISPAQIAKTEAAIREQFKPASASTGGESELASLRARTIEAERYLASLKSLGLEADKLTEGERAALRLREELKGTLTAQVRASKEASLAEAERLGGVQRLIVAEKDQAEQTKKNAAETAKFFDDSVKAQAAAVNATDKTIESLKKQATAEREATASIGLTKEALAELTAAKYDDSAASQERMANIMAEAGEPELLIKKYREEAAALRDLATAKRERGAAQTAEDLSKASDKAADEATRQWRSAADRIEDTLTNSLMRGFESGKGFAENLRDTVKNMFNTMVLRPVIQAVVGGVGGLGGAAASAATGTGGGDILSGASGLLGLSGTMSTFGSYLATGFMNTVAGSGFAASMGAASGLASGGAVAGGAGMAAGAAIPYVAVALAVANVLGLMRSNKVVGGGLMGTLGEGDIDAYDLNRRGGTLLSGPDYSITNQRTSDQSQALQTAFASMRTATAGMATQLGLANDSIVNFTTRLGQDLIHPDTGGYGIKLDGLTPEAAAAKVQAALAAANDEMAQQLLGVFESVGGQAASMRMVDTGEGAYEEFVAAVDPIKTWIAGPFVRANETASAALQRLSGSLSGANAVMDTLNQTLFDASLQGASAASALVDVFGGLQNFTNATGAYYQAFYSESERNAETTEQLTKSLSGLGLAMPDTLAGFRAMVEAQDLTTESGRSTYAALVQLGPAFKQVTDAADKALEALTATAANNTASALQAVRRAVDAEKELVQVRIAAAQEQVAAIRGVFDVLSSAVTSLLGNTEGSARAGQAFIDRALTAARTTGYLPDAQDLQAAIASATSGLDRTQFASAADQQAERLNLAGRLGSLKDIAGSQLSEAERALRAAEDQLDTLESIFEEAQKQVDALNNIDNSVKSVADALADLAAAILAQQSLMSQRGAERWNNVNGEQVWRSTGGAMGVQAGQGINITGTDGSQFTGEDAVAYVNTQLALNDAASVYARAQATGISANSLDALMGWTPGTSNNWAADNNLPTFAKGGLYPGGLALVGEDGPEVINFDRPGQVYTAAQSANLLGGNSQRLEALVEGLTQEVQRLQTLTRDGNREMRRTAEATNGNPEQPMLVSTV